MSESISASVLPFSSPSLPFERRSHQRLGLPQLQVQAAGERFEILDMSAKGMAVVTSHPYAVGGHYLFELFDEGRTLMVEGEVRWCQRRSEDSFAEEESEAPTFRSGVCFVAIQDRGLQSPAAPEPTHDTLVLLEEEADRQLTEDRIQRLGQASSADEAAELLLDLLSGDFEHLVLFRIRKDEIRPWLGRGPTLVPDRLRHLRLDFQQASIFQHLRRGGSFFYGSLPAMFAHLQLLRCWHGNVHRDCALFPVRIAERLVAVLYADVGQRELQPQHLGYLREATELFTDSLVSQILRRKNADSSGAP